MQNFQYRGTLHAAVSVYQTGGLVNGLYAGISAAFLRQWLYGSCRMGIYSYLLEQEKLAGASLLILANKQDVRGALDAEEIAEALGLRVGSVFENRHWSIRGCSAVTGEGLVEGMDWMVDDVANRIFMLS